MALFLNHLGSNEQTIQRFCKWDCAAYQNLTNNLVSSAFFPLFSILAKFLGLVTNQDAFISNIALGSLFLLLCTLGWISLWNEKLIWAALAFSLTAVTRAQEIWMNWSLSRLGVSAISYMRGDWAG